ncbi:TetR/AcrR family transcriptional regulator [Streptomyces sp. NBC_01565]|uniref:TetR/AcrR family transcriptional regulator n=1 Tax=unclassified Streptomyces TaxID=2593676 RepID=UPI00224F4699|nr:TetR/AcrR family transcriptional regulator [Streptomyces sp. NBC_01565]MCX4539532.1 TetR/AcrR family transcriptional regulator [Streptomyces sp. NBC_01565]
MARPKEFDPHTALVAAMELFRRQGYEATSVQDLVDALGVNRSSMYAAYGSKHDLYLKALDLYCAVESGRAQQALAAPESGSGEALPVLRGFLLSYVDAALDDPARGGCLVTHGVLERLPRDAAAAERFGGALGSLEEAFAYLLLRARVAGELAPGTDVRSTARFLVTLTQGLRVMERVADRAYLTHVVDQALRGLTRAA